VIFIDTNVAIAFRDGEAEARVAIIDLAEKPVLSVITRIELENGVNRDSAGRDYRRRLLDRMLESFAVQMFTQADILTYGDIVHAIGYDRIRTLDRLIAAQAIVRDATLITRNGKDFRTIGGLRLIEWETPKTEGMGAE